MVNQPFPCSKLPAVYTNSTLSDLDVFAPDGAEREWVATHEVVGDNTSLAGTSLLLHSDDHMYRMMCAVPPLPEESFAGI